MREVVTTVLDVLALLTIAAGVAWSLWQWIGPAALIVSGVVIALASLGASRPESTK